MESYLLPLIVVFPVVFQFVAARRPEFFFYPFIYSGSFLIATLTGFCVLSQSQIDWVLLTIPMSSDRPFVSLGLSLDALSGVVGTTVLTIGAVVSRFSFKYLQDDPQRQRFMKNLSWTLTSVMVMITSQNLILFFLSWVLTSYFLHQLLTHFEGREGAIRAARQKFWISRLGDLFILLSSLILFLTFKTLDFHLIFKDVSDPHFVDANHLSIHVASFLLVLGAMTKSAQFPFHFWLPNTMETPTPVSAIMHAGIINGGGYLILRMSPLLAEAPLSLILLTFVGGITIFYAVLIMLTQTSVKKSLAYSTIAQMGFMMLQCGLGVFHLAVLHIVGHAFYKAYVFLSSTTATDFGKIQRYFSSQRESHNLWAPFLVAIVCVTGVFGGMLLAGISLSQRPGESLLLFIFSLALAQLILSSRNKLVGCVTALLVGLTYKVVGEVLRDVLRGHVAQDSIIHVSELFFFVFIAVLFLLLYFIQNNLAFINQTSWGRRLYVKFYSKGFFDNSLSVEGGECVGSRQKKRHGQAKK